MKYYSTYKKNKLVSFKEAVLKGLADDGGLFMPEKIPVFEPGFFNNIDSMSFQDISFEIAKQLLQKDVPTTVLRDMIDDALNFDAPLIQLDEHLFVLELFHGPTLAFKDFGARMMARLMSYVMSNSDRELTILVATSGDTGSAVAHGFHHVEGIRVFILYPSGKISTIQEKQLTTMGGNITAIEIDGSFDDCQRLVKQAFLDDELSKKLLLTSANSINIARLIPQSFYYFYAFAQLKDKHAPCLFSVPCGNFGNLTGGILAKRMGLPVSKFIAATNVNDVFPRYLQSGIFKAQPMKATISNAMDVGNPSNLARIQDLYSNNVANIKTEISSASFSDEETKMAIAEIFQKYGYISDPHGAVGYLGLKQFSSKPVPDNNAIFLETAHPAKFLDIVQNIVPQNIEIPERLQKCLNQKKHSIRLSNQVENLKSYLFSLNH